MSNVKVNLDPVSIMEIKLGINKNGPVHSYFTKLCKEEMDPFVPYGDTGLLADTATYTTNEIIYDQLYAHYMYEGVIWGPNIPVFDTKGNIVKWWSKAPKYQTMRKFEYNTDKHPLATSHWDQVMWSAKEEDITNKVQRFVDRGNKE